MHNPTKDAVREAVEVLTRYVEPFSSLNERIKTVLAALADAERDSERLDVAMNLDVNVLPTDDGKWLLVDFRALPVRSTEYATYRDALDAAAKTETK